MDAFTDFAGNLITAVPRLRMAVRGGEIAKGKILKDPEIIETIRRLIELLKETLINSQSVHSHDIISS